MEQWEQISLGTALGMTLLILKDVVHTLLQKLRNGHEKMVVTQHPTVREYITEVWQDRVIKEIEDLHKTHESQLKRLSNVRDIVRDIARKLDLPVHYDDH